MATVGVLVGLRLTSSGVRISQFGQQVAASKAARSEFGENWPAHRERSPAGQIASIKENISIRRFAATEHRILHSTILTLAAQRVMVESWPPAPAMPRRKWPGTRHIAAASPGSCREDVTEKDLRSTLARGRSRASRRTSSKDGHRQDGKFTASLPEQGSISATTR
jgi:hypothetical protein